MDTKIIAYYLPQFHRIKENDEWWGEGFTEWENVKRAVSLFSGHNQPVMPLGENYYNLLDINTVKWQTNIAVSHGIYGFAYYHYWYEGKKLLEKPAENLLGWKDIDQRFFFFWANHTWYKSVKGVKTVLIKQTYGDRTDWTEHYSYMKHFFADNRYMKISNKPIVGIYMPMDIPDFDEMVGLWNCLAKNDGFDGIYIIESLNTRTASITGKYTDAGVIRQPNVSKEEYIYHPNKVASFLFKILRKAKWLALHKDIFFKYDFAKIMKYEYETSLENRCNSGEPIYYGISVGWDNTPRHGAYGQVMVNVTPDNFRLGFEKLYSKSCKEEKEFIFINAWNEWAEGMYLEPDERYGYEFLDVIKDVKESVCKK